MPSNSVSLNSLAFSLVGAGKVGTSLAHWLVDNGARLRQVASRNADSAHELTTSLGGRSTQLHKIRTAEDDLLLVAVSDSALQQVALALADQKQAPVVLHTSGRTSGEVLAPLRSKGSAIGSLHPLKAFPRVLADRSEAANVVYGIDGDPGAQLVAKRLARGLSGRAAFIPPEARSQYHLAATIAAGGVVTMLASAAELATSVGLEHEVVAGYLRLARDAIEQAQGCEPIAAAITGPIARGDLDGLRDQIEGARSQHPELADFLEALADRTVYYCQSLRSVGPELPRS